MSTLDEIRDSVGEEAVRLAYHAALPVVVDATLLHLLRVNFFLDPPDAVDYDHEAALLLSPLFREVSEGLYEIEPELRNSLLSGLYTRYGTARVRRVAGLLEQYTDASAAWRALPSLEAAQRLTAVSFLDPDEALRWLAASETALAGNRTGATAADPMDLGREWHVAMRRRVEEQSAVRGFDEEIEEAKTLLSDPSPGRRMAGVEALGALARHPEGDSARVVGELCGFVNRRCMKDTTDADVPVSQEVQAALTLIGTIPYAGVRKLEGITLIGVDLRRLDFRRAQLRDISLVDVDATGIDLTDARIVSAVMEIVTLDGARLDRAHLGLRSVRHVSMRQVSVDGTVFEVGEVEDVAATDMAGDPIYGFADAASSVPERQEPDLAESVAARFAGDLRELRSRAGEPSYSALERHSKQSLKRATISDVLHGRRVNLPDWRFVAAFVEACHAAARELGVDEGALGTLAEWKRRWEDATISRDNPASQDPATTSLGPDDPVQVGRYRIIHRLGEGGMGKVFLGVSPGGRQVAVKILAPELAADREFRAELPVRLAAARRVGGIHTAPVVDADSETSLPWVVSSYIPGPTLAAAVQERGQLSLPEVLQLGAGLAEGLAAIHSCGLVHHDLKPTNIILAEDGPRIIDFALPIANITMVPREEPRPIGFMSPEQVEARPLDRASDVFTLGCVLAYAATGRSPFQADTTDMATYVNILTKPPDLTGLSGPLRDLIFWCVHKSPADRPPLSAVIAALTADGSGPSASLGTPEAEPLPQQFPDPQQGAPPLVSELPQSPPPAKRRRWWQFRRPTGGD